MGMATEPHQFHVLAVDDSLIDRKLIERLLKTSSYQVTTVDSGSKALQFLGLYEDETGSPPDSLPATLNNHQEVNVNLIITDYCMPGMTGYDLLKKIKESSFLKSIPVVIMSSENIPSRISRCLEEGAEEFFLKPVQLADVNRLKPHMMKFKFKDQQQVKLQESSLKPELQPQPPPLSQHQQQQEAVAQQQPQPVPQQASNNKRKAMEDGLSPDRTRPRYSGLAMV